MATSRGVQKAVLQAVSRLGYGREALRLYHRSRGLPNMRHLEGVDESIRSFELPAEDRKGYVLLSLLRGSYGINFRSAVLAHAFRARGYEPIVLKYDDSIEQCPLANHRRDHAAVSDVCAVNTEATMDAFGIGTTTVAELLPSSYSPPSFDDATLGAIEYRGIDIARYARGSTRKYFRKHSIDLGDERERSVYVRNLRSAARIADAIDRLLDEVPVAAALATEVVYVHGGVPLAVAHGRGIPSYSHDMGYRDETLMLGSFGNRDPQPQFTDEGAIAEILSRPLSSKEGERLDSLMERRAAGDDTIHNYSTLSDVSVERPDADGPVVGMFTNLIWDASLEVDRSDIPFQDALAWIEATVDHFAARDDATLVVKTHPAEAQRGTMESVTRHVLDHAGPLPSNVVLLGPDTDVSTYALIRDLDAGVVFNSTVGVEMAYSGLPVVVGGETHYRDFGFTHEPTTREEYFDLLASPGELDFTEEMRELARRYAYVMFVRQNVPFPFITVDTTFRDFRFEPVSHADLAPGNEHLDLIVDRVLGDEAVLRP